jgi:rhodanese-related sulfurtransferase
MTMITIRAAYTPMEVKSGPKRKIQCGRSSASSSSSWLRNFRGSGTRPKIPARPALRWHGGCARSLDTVPYAEVEPAVVKARLARGEDVFLLDVREAAEVAAWAYPVGVNIPMGELGARLDEIPRGVTVVVACHVGGRSAAVAQALSEAGWDAENLTGGAVAWAAGEGDGQG